MSKDKQTRPNSYLILGVLTGQDEAGSENLEPYVWSEYLILLSETEPHGVGTYGSVHGTRILSSVLMYTKYILENEVILWQTKTFNTKNIRKWK